MWTSSLVLLALLAAPALGAGKLGIGRVATPEEIRGWDIDVRADGNGLPQGKGTTANGEKIYAKQCVSCHGAEGKSPPLPMAPALAGGGSAHPADPHGRKTVGNFWPYAPTLYDYIRRAMPWGAGAGMLSDEDVYSVTAYVLFLNGLFPKDGTLDAAKLAAIRMPNRDGFTPDPRPDVP